MASIDPDPNRFGDLLSKIPQGQPVVMLNLLRFRETANYRNGEDAVSGRDAYGKYSELTLPFLGEVGGKLIHAGPACATLIGPPDEHWDHMLLVRYPSIEKFMEMVTNPDYQAITHHRTAALEDARLIATLEA